jgi:hypothetical protein
MSNPSYNVSISAAMLYNTTNSASSTLNAGIDYGQTPNQLGDAAEATTTISATTITATTSTNVLYGQQVGGNWQWGWGSGNTNWPWTTTQPIVTTIPGTITIPSVPTMWPLSPKWPENIPDTIGLLYIKNGKLMMMTEDGAEVELVDLSTADGETAQILIAVAAKKKLSEGVPVK